MLLLLEDYLERLQALHVDMNLALADLPDEALDWQPGVEMNSLAVLASHVAGAERFWIGELVGGEPAGRVREQEFETVGLETAVLVARLEAALAHSREVLARLSSKSLAERRIDPRNGHEYSLAWCLFHALEHTATHTGHMQLTRQLWALR